MSTPAVGMIETETFRDEMGGLLRVCKTAGRLLELLDMEIIKDVY